MRVLDTRCSVPSLPNQTETNWHRRGVRTERLGSIKRLVKRLEGFPLLHKGTILGRPILATPVPSFFGGNSCDRPSDHQRLVRFCALGHVLLVTNLASLEASFISWAPSFWLNSWSSFIYAKQTAI